MGQIEDWAAKWGGDTSLYQEPGKWNKSCAHCGRRINFNPYNGDSYRGCWCDRWWCSQVCSELDGWVFVGDAYDTDHISCNHCKESKSRREEG